ncbi:hypothetical protein ACWGHM_35090 [Streptomyces sp. NPDC054904]|uniref:hypothetical protein n=1 Tax=unclassified Streptomyces TaxID=2593676 RepID=UPI002481FD0A|nr:hypothetical protein [Streptomyces sp. Isolate_45]MDA5278996.1 hypothetical protein [Streptomyces sp. Isolate_45]
MHAPGIPPQQGPHGHRPTSSTVVTLRVLFAVLPVISCGFLAWGAMLRLALVTRKTRDWVLLVVSGVLAVVWMTFIQIDPTAETNGWQGNLGAGGSILTGFATCVYFLIADIKHNEALAAAGPVPGWYPQAAPQPPYMPPPQQQTNPAYGYPPAHTPVPAPAPRVPQAPHNPPQATPPPRIGQVRAELDELSELLRRPQQQPPRPGGPYQDPNDTARQDRDK